MSSSLDKHLLFAIVVLVLAFIAVIATVFYATQSQIDKCENAGGENVRGGCYKKIGDRYFEGYGAEINGEWRFIEK